MRLRAAGTRKHPGGPSQVPPEPAESLAAFRRLWIEPRINSWEWVNRVEIKVRETSGDFKGVSRLSTWVQEDQGRVVKAMLGLQEMD